MNLKANYDFSQPNKLERKALFLVLNKALWAMFKGFWPIFALFAIKGFPADAWWVYLAAAGVVMLAFIRVSINYFYFSYQVIHDEFVIKKGWLNKSTTVIKLDKIHEINLNQKFIHKLIGLYLVNIDTAGSSKTEIEINGIDFKKALALKDVLAQKVEVESDSVILEEDIPNQTASNDKIKIDLFSLIKIGLTRNYLQTFGLMIAFSFQIIEQLQDFFYEDDTSVYDNIINNSYQEYLGILGIVLFLGLIILIIAFNLVRTLLTYFNYQLNLKDKHLTASYGLTDSHIVSVPANKVQMFQFQQNYFQKVMNLFEVKIKQVESSEDNKKKKGLIIPGANQLELNKIFRVIFGDNLIDFSSFYKPNQRVLLIKFLWLCVPFSIALTVLYFTGSFSFVWIVLLFFVLFFVLICIGYKNEKMVFKNDFIVLKKGIWDISTMYLPIDKIQKVTITQSYFQQKSQIGSLNLHTAAGTVTMYYYDFTMLQPLANEILYKIEKNNRLWM